MTSYNESNAYRHSWYAIVTCRNSASTILKALTSLVDQTFPPAFIIVIDDGSRDATKQLISKFQGEVKTSILLVTKPDLGYDISRVVHHWNDAVKMAWTMQPTRYYLISADDIELEPDYVETLMIKMIANNAVIGSGAPVGFAPKIPSGAGRLIDRMFFDSEYPERIGYETWLVLWALIVNQKVVVEPKCKFVHLRTQGSAHHFREWGAGMKALGYDPLYVLGRIVKYLIAGRPITRSGALRILTEYLMFKPEKSGYMSAYDVYFRKRVSAIHRREIARIVTGK